MSELNEKVEEPQGQPSERPPIPPEQLQEILEAHRKWVESEWKEGERANLGRANLQEADLIGANLQEADLIGANLQEADLRGANLEGADLRGAKLQGAYLGWANLQEAYLGGAEGLTASQVMAAYNWELAFYSDDFIKKLGLPRDHNERLEKKLAELEKEKEATGAEP